MVLAALATPQQALDARYTDPRLAVYVNGVLTPVTRFSSRHRIGEIAEGRLELLLPQPAHVEPMAPVVVHGGHNDFVQTIFSGFIPVHEGSLSNRGAVLDVQLAGQASRMAEELREDLVFGGPISLRALFVALCDLCAVPSYIADHTTYPDGVTEVMLGGNSRHEDGQVRIRAGSTPFAAFNRLAAPYEYYASDWPSGPVVLRRVNGMPPTAPVATWQERLHLETVRVTTDVRELVNYWDVWGITYEDEYGGRVPVRSRPSTVTPHEDILGDGIRYRKVTNSDLVRQDQADAVRNNLEIRHSATYRPVRWTSVAIPGIGPGDVVGVTSETTGATGAYWLLEMTVESDDDGYTGTHVGWAGAGEALPALNDRVEIAVQTAPVHLGNETLTHYAVDAPSGRSQVWTIEVPDAASAANIRGFHHGTNSQIVNGAQAEIEVTRWEVWDPAVPASQYDSKGADAPRPEASGTMPSVPEELGLRRNYSTFTVVGGVVTNPGYWTPFAIDLGRLDPGTWKLRLVSGEKNGPDDFEVRMVVLELWGTVEPAVAIPQEGGSL